MKREQSARECSKWVLFVTLSILSIVIVIRVYELWMKFSTRYVYMISVMLLVYQVWYSMCMHDLKALKGLKELKSTGGRV